MIGKCGPLSVKFSKLKAMIVLHNDGGANCFIFNDPALFWRLKNSSLSIRQLDGSHITADGFGVVVI
jgi:hypothetical protein